MAGVRRARSRRLSPPTPAPTTTILTGSRPRSAGTANAPIASAADGGGARPPPQERRWRTPRRPTSTRTGRARRRRGARALRGRARRRREDGEPGERTSRRSWWPGCPRSGRPRPTSSSPRATIRGSRKTSQAVSAAAATGTRRDGARRVAASPRSTQAGRAIIAQAAAASSGTPATRGPSLSGVGVVRRTAGPSRRRAARRRSRSLPATPSGRRRAARAAGLGRLGRGGGEHREQRSRASRAAGAAPAAGRRRPARRRAPPAARGRASCAQRRQQAQGQLAPARDDARPGRAPWPARSIWRRISRYIAAAAAIARRPCAQLGDARRCPAS